MAEFEPEYVVHHRTEHPDAQWFPEAGMGLFVHWGIHSVAGLQPSWAMIRGYPCADTDVYPRERYYALAWQFNPDHYEPERWLDAARKAGFAYAVLTTKHHDGYSLWPSEHAVLGTHTCHKGCDLVEPFVRACRNVGLKVGLYFSFADWAWPGFPMPDCDFDHGRRNQHPPMSEEEDEIQFDAFYAFATAQVRELLTRYGRIDLLWFDGVGWRDRDPGEMRGLETIRWIRSLQPHIVVNNRWGRVGDYITPECEMPETRPDRWWEACMVSNGHWGYNPDNRLPDIDWWVDHRDRCNAWGGNFLPNVGPAPDGTMPEDFYERCQQLQTTSPCEPRVEQMSTTGRDASDGRRW
ncbi:MAG: alpha-L-fucosidase [Thioalkalivibrio sp.]|nr:alpha-L-fucosidase [Thioalkalivibrio sp.]